MTNPTEAAPLSALFKRVRKYLLRAGPYAGVSNRKNALAALDEIAERQHVASLHSDQCDKECAAFRRECRGEK